MRITALVISALLAIAGLGSSSDTVSPVASPAFKKSPQSLNGYRNTWGSDSGDINGDGAPDVLLATLGGPSRLYLNDGKGRFKESAQTFPGDMHDVAMGDLDNDGDRDLFFVSVRQGCRPVYLNDGKGGFTNTSFTAEASETIQLIDIDNDRDLDAYLGSRGTIYLNGGRGNFAPGQTSLPGFAALADLNGDGFADLIGMGEARGARGFVTYINDGKGNLKQTLFIPQEDLAFGYLEIADIDNDGDNDVLYTNSPG